MEWPVGPYELDRCPLRCITIDVRYSLMAYKRYEKGYLPNEGGWCDQGAKFNEIMDIIDTEVGMIQREAEKNRAKR